MQERIVTKQIYWVIKTREKDEFGFSWYVSKLEVGKYRPEIELRKNWRDAVLLETRTAAEALERLICCTDIHYVFDVVKVVVEFEV